MRLRSSPANQLEQVNGLRSFFGDLPLSTESLEILYLPTQELPQAVHADPAVVSQIGALSGHKIAGDGPYHLNVVKALLYFAAGALDHSHNLVLPLSWPSATPLAGTFLQHCSVIKPAVMHICSVSACVVTGVSAGHKECIS